MLGLTPLMIAAALAGPAPEVPDVIVTASRAEVRVPQGEWKPRFSTRKLGDGTRVFVYRAGRVTIESHDEIRFVLPNGIIRRVRPAGDALNIQDIGWPVPVLIAPR